MEYPKRTCFKYTESVQAFILGVCYWHRYANARLLRCISAPVREFWTFFITLFRKSSGQLLIILLKIIK